MDTDKHGWDLERAAAWLRRHGWGDAGEEGAPAQLEPQATEAAAQADPDPDPGADEEIDIACWPALVAPFYD